MKKTSVKKQRIIEITLSLVRERGYEAVSLSDISGAVGISKSGMFAHFSNKEEIIFEALRWSIKQLSEALSIEPTLTGLERFKVLLETIATYLKTERKCVGLHLLYGLSADLGKINSSLHEFFSLLKTSLSQPLYQLGCMEEDIIEKMVEDIVSQLEGATIWLLLDDNSSAIDRAVELGVERASALVRSSKSAVLSKNNE